jgi:pimeloyl-ACP methyl ester carboxylesterase
LALIFVGTVVYLFDDRLPLADRISPVTTFGTLVLGGFALALLLLGRRAYRNAQLRRTLGILWDLATFWPRASHPLAPPCYCERALPDLICRIRAAAPTGDRRVVLSAHSQGTVIAAALVLQLEDDERERVRLVTYGSPLRRGDGAARAGRPMMRRLVASAAAVGRASRAATIRRLWAGTT